VGTTYKVHLDGYNLLPYLKGGSVANWLQSLKELPQRQKPGRFNLDQVMQQMMSGTGGKFLCDDLLPVS
jgi:hypothetical protein